MSKEAMKLALEALEDANNFIIEVEGEDAYRHAITALEEALAKQTSVSEVEQGEQDNYQGSDAAKAAHMMDLYTALGVKWGEDPFAVIAKMRSIAGAEKQERPTGPATSADRYFYEAGFEAGRQQGMKQEHGEPVAWAGYNLDDMCEAFDRVIEEHHSRTNPFHDPVNKDAMLALRILRGFIPYMKRYTTPPQGEARGLSQQQQQRIAERKPLTDENPLLVFAKECVLGAYSETELANAAFRAIEAAHGIIQTYPEKDKS